MTHGRVTGEQYGRFLVEVFEEWGRYDVGDVFVQMFDTALAHWLGMDQAGMCVHARTCGSALALEYCLDCDVRSACNGGCPKDRFATTPDGQRGLHYLCAGYQAFFHHVDTPMRFMAARLRAGQDATALRDWYAAADARRAPDDPCTCGNGRTWKQCHGTGEPTHVQR